MANTIDFNVSTNAVTVLNQTGAAAENTAKGFTSAKAELRALNNQLLTMDKTSEAFKKASTRAAELKDDISDLSAEINANAGNAFEGLSNNVGLFGSRLMDLDLKGAGQALSGMGAAVGRIDFKTLKDEVGALAKGFGDLAFSVIANPYILLGGAVVALGYTFRKELLAPITDVIAANEKLRSSIQFTSEEIASAAGDEIKQISKLEELKIALNDTTTSTEKRKLAVKELQKINPVYFKDLDSEKLKYTELNTQIDNYVKGLVAQSLAKAASARIEQEAGKYLDEEIKRRDQLSNANARLAIAQAELADKAKAVEESGTNLFGGKSYGAGFERAKTTAAATGYSIMQLELEIKALNESEFASKAAYEQRVADLVNFKKIQEEIVAGFGITPPATPTVDNKKELDDYNKSQQELTEILAKWEQERLALEQKAREDYIHANQSAQANELYDLEQKKIKELALFEGSKEDKILINETYRLLEIDINTKYDDLALQKQLEANEKQKAADEKAKEDAKKRQQEAAQFEIESQTQLAEAKWNIANSSISLLGTLFAKNKKAADLAFALEKGLAIAKIVVSNRAANAEILGKQLAFYASSGPLALPLATASSAPMMAANNLNAAASIAAIVASGVSKFMGGGGASLSSPSMGGGGGTTAPSPANFAFLQNQPNQQPPLQAYVVGTQVSSNLEAQQLIQNQSRLGG
jgi:hypothetical protein